MTTINLESYVSPRLQELIQEANHSIQTVKEKILAAYNYAIETDKLTPKTAAKILREQLHFSDRYIREVLPLEAKEVKFANKSTTKNDDHDEEERVPPTLNELPDQYQDSSNKVAEESDLPDTVNITTAYDVNEVETIDTTPSSNDENYEIKNFNDDTISTTTTITTTDEDNRQSSSSITTIEPNEYIRQYDDIEVTKQMLHYQIEKNRYLVNQIRELRGAEPLKVSKEEQEEELEDERMKLEIQNDTEEMVGKDEPLFINDESLITEFISYWDQLKRLFRQMVEMALYRAEKDGEKLSIQDAIYDVFYYLEGHRGLSNIRLKLPDGLARYISEYFIDQKSEMYLKIKFQVPRKNEDTLGFKEWRKELTKTPKQRKEDKKLFLEQSRENTKRWLEQLNQENEK
jgi:hypothetical protein